MLTFINRILPTKDKPRKWMSMAITILIAGVFTLIGIYGIGVYGISLFILTPVFIGACPVVLYANERPISKADALKLSVMTMAVFGFLLLVCAIEGAICIAMSAPFAIILSLVGSSIGQAISSKMKTGSILSLLLLVLSIPLTSFVEQNSKPEIVSVTTSIEINAPIENVWKNVIQFPKLEEPDEFLFKAGIAYPTNAVIKGSGKGAIRYCNFSTGSFVEPITTWNEPYLLAFDVQQQPIPMRELSFWDIDAPHLHDFFVSEKGQFKLTRLGNGKTLVEGTTWYHHDISPEFYWRLWSDLIVHKIHERVLTHIKINSEKTF